MDLPMIPFLTYRQPNEEGNLLYYILQRAFPHYDAVLLVYPKEGALAQSPIPGYSLWIVIVGTLRGAVIPGYQDVVNEMQSVADQMAAWYLENRIMTDEKKFKRWKVLPA
jgi:hypothetical protein